MIIKNMVFISLFGFSLGAGAMYAPKEIETVPIERVIANLERQISKNNEKWGRQAADRSRLSLARLHAMAYVNGWRTARVDKKDDTQWGEYCSEISGKCDGRGWVFAKKEKVKEPSEKSIAHLKKSIENYEKLIGTTEFPDVARLGLAWTLEQDGQIDRAKSIYRAIVADFKSKMYSVPKNSRVLGSIQWIGKYSQLYGVFRQGKGELEAENIYKLLVRSFVESVFEKERTVAEQTVAEKLKELEEAIDQNNQALIFERWASLKSSLKVISKRADHIEFWFDQTLGLYKIALGVQNPSMDYDGVVDPTECRNKTGIALFRESSFSGFELCMMSLAVKRGQIDLCNEMARLTQNNLAQTYCITFFAKEKKESSFCDRIDVTGMLGGGPTELDCKKIVNGEKGIANFNKSAPSLFADIHGGLKRHKDHSAAFALTFESDLRGFPSELKLVIKNNYTKPSKSSSDVVEEKYFSRQDHRWMNVKFELLDSRHRKIEQIELRLPKYIRNLEEIENPPEKLFYERYAPEHLIAEVAFYLKDLLDPVRDKKELAMLKRVVWSQASRRYTRPITPIAIPLNAGVSAAERIIDHRARVKFDLDGSGIRKDWQWISTEAAWLVHSPKGVDGRITSGLQLFGNVTFWLFWENGYEAMKALDDNDDGWITGDELRDLALWHDRNQNGVSEAGEIKRLSESGIRGLSTVHKVHPENGYWSRKGVLMSDGTFRDSFDVILANF